jgi:hypothetical protein
MYKKIIFICCLLVLFSCRHSEGENQSSTTKVSKINYKNLEQLEGIFGRGSFKVPKGLYKKTEENIFISNSLNSRIEFISKRWDVGDVEFISSKDGFIEKYKNNIKVVSIKSDNESFEIIVENNKNNIYIKGYFIIGYGHDAITGEADLKAPFFAMAGILKVQYPIENKRDFNNLLPIIKKTYKCNFGEF